MKFKNKNKQNITDTIKVFSKKQNMSYEEAERIFKNLSQKKKRKLVLDYSL